MDMLNIMTIIDITATVQATQVSLSVTNTTTLIVALTMMPWDWSATLESVAVSVLMVM